MQFDNDITGMSIEELNVALAIEGARHKYDNYSEDFEKEPPLIEGVVEKVLAHFSVNEIEENYKRLRRIVNLTTNEALQENAEGLYQLFIINGKDHPEWVLKDLLKNLEDEKLGNNNAEILQKQKQLQRLRDIRKGVQRDWGLAESIKKAEEKINSRPTIEQLREGLRGAYRPEPVAPPPSKGGFQPG